MKKQIIYIGGYGRSGSTLLDIILGDIIPNTGELASLPSLSLEDKVHCTCGNSFNECAVWSKVLQNYQANDLRRLYKLFKSRCRFTSLFLTFIIGNDKKTEQARNAFRSFYDKIFSAYNTNSIVESSKTTAYCHARPVYLKLVCGYNVKLIHLVRDPRDVYKSRKKCKNVLNIKEPTTISFVWIRTVLSWFISNLAALQGKIFLGTDNYLLIRYEDLVADPEARIREIGKFLSVNVDHILKKINNNEYFLPNHLVGGNRMARKGRIRLGKNIAPHREMPAWQQAATWLVLFPLSSWLGYRIVDFPPQLDKDPRAWQENMDQQDSTSKR